MSEKHRGPLATEGCCLVVENHQPREASRYRLTPRAQSHNSPATSFRPETQHLGHFCPFGRTHVGTCALSSTGHQAATSHVFTVSLNGTHLPVATPTGARGTQVYGGLLLSTF